MIVIGVLLITYLAGQKQTLDYALSLIAGVAMIAVAFLPTERPSVLRNRGPCVRQVSSRWVMLRCNGNSVSAQSRSGIRRRRSCSSRRSRCMRSVLRGCEGPRWHCRNRPGGVDVEQV